MIKGKKIAVVIPCYCVRNTILKVIEHIPDFVDSIICVDDNCPEKSGEFVNNNLINSRIRVIFNDRNLGVGGAVIHGIKYCLSNSLGDVIIKIDGDGQMDPGLIPVFISPIIDDNCDYTKGNRFSSRENLQEMPLIRMAGNFILSYINKICSGYWDLFDPTNGYIACSSRILQKLDFSSISTRYFFESDMLFHLHNLEARICDIPMKASYGSEKSHLNAFSSIATFSYHHALNFARRIFLMIRKKTLSAESILAVLTVCCFTGMIIMVATGSESNNICAGLLLSLVFMVFFIFFDIRNYRKKFHVRRTVK